jgi:hypothetical protein
MRITLLVIALCSLQLISATARCQTAPEPASTPKPKVYALVAAIGDQLEVVVDAPVNNGFSRLSPYRHMTQDVSNNVLNRFALHILDQEVAKFDPNSKRIYMAIAAGKMSDVPSSKRDEVAIARVIEDLRNMPERAGWDKIVVLTPAYQGAGRDYMAPKLQGIGVFAEPRCQDSCSSIMPGASGELMQEPSNGVPSENAKGEKFKSRTFIAPYSYVAVWVIDPRTLAVLDKQERFDNKKLAEKESDLDSVDPVQSSIKPSLGGRIINLIEVSVREGVEHSNLRGIVDVGDVREAAPGDTKK